MATLTMKGIHSASRLPHFSKTIMLILHKCFRLLLLLRCRHLSKLFVCRVDESNLLRCCCGRHHIALPLHRLRESLVAVTLDSSEVSETTSLMLSQFLERGTLSFFSSTIYLWDRFVGCLLTSEAPLSFRRLLLKG